MDLQKALESVLIAILSDHVVLSWNIAAEGQKPTVILRLRPVNVRQDMY